MAVFNLRDVPDETVAAIDAAAKRQRRSRQEYLLEKLVREYGSGENVTLAIAMRLRDLLMQLSDCKSYYLKPTPTIARVAECLGFDSTAPLDELLRSDRPLSFTDADRICELFGVNRRWLLEGSEHRFGMPPVFSEPWQMLKAITLDQLKWGDGRHYEELVFVLPPLDMHCTCVFGRRDATGYRVDLLLNSVPLYGGTGGTGQKLLFDFCLFAAALSQGTSGHPLLGRPQGVIHTSAYISKTPEQYTGLLWGDRHLSCSRTDLNQSTWLEDIWNLEYTKAHQHYPQAWRNAYADFKIIAEHKHTVTTNNQLFELLEKKMEKIRSRAAESAEFKPDTGHQASH